MPGKVTVVPIPCAEVTNLPPDSGSLRDVRVLLAGGLAQGGVLVLWGGAFGSETLPAKGQGRGGLCRTALRDLNAAAQLHQGKHFSSFTSPPASYHDNVVLGEAVWQLCHVTPVGRLLAGDNDTGGRYFHGLHVAGQLGDGDVGL